MGVTCVVVVGGMDMTQQALELGKRPHIIVATPGRLVDHLEKTKGFNLKALKYLVRQCTIMYFFVKWASLLFRMKVNIKETIDGLSIIRG